MENNLPINRIAEETLSRSDIIAVSASFLITMAPHFTHIPIWVSALVLLSLGWRGLEASSKLASVPKWLLILMVISGGLGVFAQYWTIAGRDAGLALLTVMASFKFLESRTHRDLLILIFLSYFLLATHFLFDQSILIALFMFACLIIITATLITINQRGAQVSIKARIASSARLIGLSLPIMVLLFILVPRIPGPLWGLTQEQRGGVTGLSDDMSPGSINNLVGSNDVAFRVDFETEIPQQSQLYWRGPVMVKFDGRRWSQGPHGKFSRITLPARLEQSRYTITLEPNGKRWLFGLDLPVTILPNSYMSSEFQLTNNKPINDLRRYSLVSRLTYQLGLEERFEYLLQASEFNEQLNPRTIALGREWAEQLASDEQIVERALKMFRSEEFVYTLKPPLLGAHPSDEFLFETRRGFCEHYASSFALLMRAAGIPTRVVTGYQGGELNELGNYLIVRQSDAHAWTEVWLEGRGWVRVDPTAAVSPERVESSLERALPDGLVNFRFAQRSPLLSKLLFSWDNMQHKWNDWVLNYNENKQRRFLRQLGLGIHSWADMIIALVIGLVLMTGSYALFAWYRERPPKPPQYEIIINRLLKKLARRGFKRQASESLSGFLERMQQEQGAVDTELEQIVKAYTRIKYAQGYQQEVVIRRFASMVDQWRPNA